MRKMLLNMAAVLLLLPGALPVQAAGPRAGELVEALAAGFRSLPAYRVSFVVDAGDHRVAGRYDVAGESYYLVLGDIEVYCDGRTRYEVDNRRREVTLGEVDAASRNVLDNPVHAFDFVGDRYRPELVREDDGEAVVRLTPVADDVSPAGVVTVGIDTRQMRPRSLAYALDGEQVRIDIMAVVPLSSGLEGFSKERYAGYEFIDFR